MPSIGPPNANGQYVGQPPPKQPSGTSGSGSGPSSLLSNGHPNSFNGYSANAMPAPGTNLGTPADQSGTSGGNSGNSNTSTPLTAPGGTNFSGWNWEDVLNGVLGLKVPNRNDIKAQQWTLQVSNTSGDGAMFEIWSASWDGTKDYVVDRKSVV